MRRLLARPGFRLWLAIVGSTTIVLGAAYVMAQQSTRLAANDIPLSVLQDAKAQLNKGTSPAGIVPPYTTDIAYDSVPFVIITDNSRQLMATSALMDGKAPVLPPSGVFEYTKAHGSDRITWQPEANVRLATIVSTYKNGFIIAGQSLKEPEKRIETYTAISVISWIAIAGWSSLVLMLPAKKNK